MLKLFSNNITGITEENEGLNGAFHVKKISLEPVVPKDLAITNDLDQGAIAGIVHVARRHQSPFTMGEGMIRLVPPLGPQ